MKLTFGLLAVVVLTVGIYLFLSDDATEPARAPSGDEGAGATVPVSTPSPPTPGGRPAGGKGGNSAAAAKVMDADKVYAEFVEEMDLTAQEAKEFFEALKRSNESLLSLVGSGMPSELELIAYGPPDTPPAPIIPEELEMHLMESEFYLTEALGNDGYEKFKAYRTTLPARTVINDLGSGKSGIELTAEQKASVLYGAYEDIQRGEIPRSPNEFTASLTAAVMDRSGEYLSEGDQEKLAKQMKDKVGGMMGPGGKPPNLPGIPDPPLPGVVPPLNLEGLPGRVP